MVEVREFRPADLAALVLQPAQAEAMAAIGDWRAIARAVEGPAWTVERNGTVVAVGGLAVVWPGRYLAWSYIGIGVPKTAWTALTRMTRRFMDRAMAAGVRRIEAEVRAGWEPGERWAAMLGLHCECVAEAYFPDGAACSRWARVAV